MRDGLLVRVVVHLMNADAGVSGLESLGSARAVIVF